MILYIIGTIIFTDIIDNDTDDSFQSWSYRVREKLSPAL